VLVQARSWRPIGPSRRKTKVKSPARYGGERHPKARLVSLSQKGAEEMRKSLWSFYPQLEIADGVGPTQFASLVRWTKVTVKKYNAVLFPQ
jgi:hypothetical protein